MTLAMQFRYMYMYQWALVKCFQDKMNLELYAMFA